MRYFVLPFLLFLTSSVTGQKCECLLYSQNEKAIDFANEIMDTTAIQSWYNKLKTSPDAYCKFLGGCQEIRYFTQKRRFSLIPGLFNSLEKIEKTIHCKELTAVDIARYKADYYQKIDSIELGTKYAFDALALAEKMQNDENNAKMKQININNNKPQI